jgi:hypothetical protein
MNWSVVNCRTVGCTSLGILIWVKDGCLCLCWDLSCGLCSSIAPSLFVRVLNSCGLACTANVIVVSVHYSVWDCWCYGVSIVFYLKYIPLSQVFSRTNYLFQTKDTQTAHVRHINQVKASTCRERYYWPSFDELPQIPPAKPSSHPWFLYLRPCANQFVGSACVTRFIMDIGSWSGITLEYVSGVSLDQRREYTLKCQMFWKWGLLVGQTGLSMAVFGVVVLGEVPCTFEAHCLFAWCLRWDMDCLSWGQNGVECLLSV